MYKVYVIEDQISGMLYVGFTTDLERRILEHKNGFGGETTKGAHIWKLIYAEAYVSKNDALGREKFLKGGSGRRYLKKQLVDHFSTKGWKNESFLVIC